jgi:hypothetical protein
MAPHKLFGSLNLAGMVGAGENPNGTVAQTSNGTNINGKGSDGDWCTWGIPADGPRWNKTEPGGMMQEKAIARPVAIVASQRRR